MLWFQTHYPEREEDKVERKIKREWRMLRRRSSRTHQWCGWRRRCPCRSPRPPSELTENPKNYCEAFFLSSLPRTQYSLCHSLSLSAPLCLVVDILLANIWFYFVVFLNTFFVFLFDGTEVYRSLKSCPTSLHAPTVGDKHWLEGAVSSSTMFGPSSCWTESVGLAGN